MTRCGVTEKFINLTKICACNHKCNSVRDFKCLWRLRFGSVQNGLKLMLGPAKTGSRETRELLTNPGEAILVQKPKRESVFCS
jgi:hypothetical protein